MKKETLNKLIELTLFHADKRNKKLRTELALSEEVNVCAFFKGFESSDIVLDVLSCEFGKDFTRIEVNPREKIFTFVFENEGSKQTKVEVDDLYNYLTSEGR